MDKDGDRLKDFLCESEHLTVLLNISGGLSLGPWPEGAMSYDHT